MSYIGKGVKVKCGGNLREQQLRAGVSRVRPTSVEARALFSRMSITYHTAVCVLVSTRCHVSARNRQFCKLSVR